MNAILTHRSFFSGVGGADLGLARAGFVTLSTSEIEPYATVVLSEREPDAEPLGCIKTVAGAPAHEHDGYECLLDDGSGVVEGGSGDGGAPGQGGFEPRGLDGADLWTGGFPCQDLSVAGKRKGFAGDRSVLAFVFLDLVEQYRPPAILLENVPGLLSSNDGRDLRRLTREMADLGYGVAYRVLDARFFGVPQRRRRVFILGLRSDGADPDGRAAAERAAEILSVGAECRWHPTKGVQAKARLAARSRARSAASGRHRGADGPATDAGGVREVDGLAGRMDDRPDVASSVTASAGHHGHSSPRGDGTDNLVAPELAYAIKATEHRSYDSGGKNGIGPVNLIVAPTLRVGPQRPEDGGPGDTVPIVVQGFALRGRGEGNVPEPFEGIVPALRGASGGSTQPFIVPLDVVQSLDTKDGGPDDNEAQAGHLVAYVKEGRAQTPEAGETWGTSPIAPTVNAFDVGDTRATVVIGTIREHVRPGSNTDHSILSDMVVEDDPLLPDGLDSHRYRCCGNGLVAAKTEWIGSRLAAAMAR